MDDEYESDAEYVARTRPIMRCVQARLVAGGARMTDAEAELFDEFRASEARMVGADNPISRLFKRGSRAPSAADMRAELDQMQSGSSSHPWLDEKQSKQVRRQSANMPAKRASLGDAPPRPSYAPTTAADDEPSWGLSSREAKANRAKMHAEFNAAQKRADAAVKQARIGALQDHMRGANVSGVDATKLLADLDKAYAARSSSDLLVRSAAQPAYARLLDQARMSSAQYKQLSEANLYNPRVQRSMSVPRTSVPGRQSDSFTPANPPPSRPSMQSPYARMVGDAASEHKITLLADAYRHAAYNAIVKKNDMAYAKASALWAELKSELGDDVHSYIDVPCWEALANKKSPCHNGDCANPREALRAYGNLKTGSWVR